MALLTQKQLAGEAIKRVVIQAVRDWFDQCDFAEVMIPAANVSVPLEPTIYPFATKWAPLGQEKTLYLSVSPEKALKKRLAAGIMRCYGIGHCFRNLEGSGQRHTPEFLMLEWYRTGADYQQIMQDVQDLILAVNGAVRSYKAQKPESIITYQHARINLANWRIISIEKLLKEKTGLELAEIITEEKLFEAAQKRGYDVSNATWEQVFNQIFLNEIESEFDRQPFFLVDFPARISPLCQINQKQNYLADRFEFYLVGMEVGNGNNENLDDQLVRDYFGREAAERRQNGLCPQPIDEDFLLCLKTMRMSGQRYAGIGLGLDRLVMLMADTQDIAEVGFAL